MTGIGTLVLRDLLAGSRIWLGAFAIAAVSAAAGDVAATLIATGASLPTLEALGLFAVSGASLVFSAIATLVILSAATTLTVALQRRSYALWQIVGVAPRTVTRIVLAQLAIVALLGSLVGALLGAAVAPAFVEFGLSNSSGLTEVTPVLTPAALLWVPVGVTLVVLLSGIRSARAAGRVGAIEALRDSDPRGARMTWIRWVLAAALLLVVISMALGLRSIGGGGGSQALLIGPLLAGALIAVGPAIFPPVLKGWTSLVPARVSPSWFLARNAAAFNLIRSTSTISSLLLTIALPGGLFAGYETLRSAIPAAADAPTSGLSASTVLLLLSGPLLLSAAGAAVIVFMSSRTRDREGALLQAAGATRPAVVATAVGEAVIHVGTAALLAAVVLALTGLGEAAMIATALPQVVPHFGVLPALTAAGAGLLLVLIATLVPTLLSLRRPVVAVLAAQ